VGITQVVFVKILGEHKSQVLSLTDDCYAPLYPLNTGVCRSFQSFPPTKESPILVVEMGVKDWDTGLEQTSRAGNAILVEIFLSTISNIREVQFYSTEARCSKWVYAQHSRFLKARRPSYCGDSLTDPKDQRSE
jgi:hypothetical protein